MPRPARRVVCTPLGMRPRESVTRITGTSSSEARSISTRTCDCSRPYANTTTASSGASARSSSANDVPVCTSAMLGLPIRRLSSSAYDARCAEGPTPRHTMRRLLASTPTASWNWSDDTSRLSASSAPRWRSREAARSSSGGACSSVRRSRSPNGGSGGRVAMRAAQVGEAAVTEGLGRTHDGRVARSESFGERRRREQRLLRPERRGGLRRRAVRRAQGCRSGPGALRARW